MTGNLKPLQCDAPACPHRGSTTYAGRCDICRRHICNASAPWHKGAGGGIHPQGREVGEQEDGYPGGDIIRCHCPVCEVTWKVEFPQ